MFAMDQVLLKLSPLRDDLLIDIQHKLIEYAERGSSTAATLTTYTSGRSMEERTQVVRVVGNDFAALDPRTDERKRFISCGIVNMMMQIFAQQDSLVGVKKRRSKAPQNVSASPSFNSINNRDAIIERS